MSEEEINVFLEWADSNVSNLPQHFPRHPKVNFGFNAYLAALAHRDKQVAELVKAVEQIRDRHLVPLANQEGQSLLRMDLNDLDDALEQLKEHHNETK